MAKKGWIVKTVKIKTAAARTNRASQPRQLRQPDFLAPEHSATGAGRFGRAGLRHSRSIHLDPWSNLSDCAATLLAQGLLARTLSRNSQAARRNSTRVAYINPRHCLASCAAGWWRSKTISARAKGVSEMGIVKYSPTRCASTLWPLMLAVPPPRRLRRGGTTRSKAAHRLRPSAKTGQYRRICRAPRSSVRVNETCEQMVSRSVHCNCGSTALSLETNSSAAPQPLRK